MQPHICWASPAALTLSWSHGVSRLLLPLDSLQNLEVGDGCFALAPHGQALARLHEDQMLRVYPMLPEWKLAGSPAFACHGSIDPRTIRTLAWSPDHRYLLTLCDTGLCCLFVAMAKSRSRGKLLTQFACPSLPAGPAPVPLAFAPRGQAVAIAQRDAVGIWDSHDGQLVAQLGEGAYQALAWSPRGRWLAMGQGETITRWRTGYSRRQRDTWQSTAPVTALAWSSSEVVASGDQMGTVLIKEPGKPPRACHPSPTSGVTALAWSPAGSQLAVLDEECQLSLYEARSGELLP